MHDFGSMYVQHIHHLLKLLTVINKSYIRANWDQKIIMGNTLIIIICAFLFQPEPEQEQEEAANPPPAKRLRSEELTRVIVIFPEGERHQLDISLESTLKVGQMNTKKKCSFRCLSFTFNTIAQIYAQDHVIGRV